MKKCSCGKEFENVPDGMKFVTEWGLYFFDCPKCHSTVTAKPTEIRGGVFANEKFDLWKHHKPGTKLYDSDKKRYCRLYEIRETAAEWIEPFVIYDGEAEPRIANSSWLEVIND